MEYLANLAAKVYYFPLYRESAPDAENIQRMEDWVKSFSKEEKLVQLQLRSGEKLCVDGVFCLRDSVTLAVLLPKLETENGHILADRTMATNLPGVYAAGDCTGRPYQYAKAVGEGNVAAHSVIEYLAACHK